MTKDFTSIADQMKQGNLTADEIAAHRSFCSGWLYTLNEQYGKMVAARATWLNQNRKDYKSQAETERAWEATPAGQAELELKYQIRAIENLNSGLETLWFLNQRDWKESRAMNG